MLKESGIIKFLKQSHNTRCIRYIGVALIAVVCLVSTFCVNLPHSFGWFRDSLKDETPMMISYIHKSYFESGDGTSPTQFQTYDENGNPIYAPGHEDGDESGCAFEIKYPVQLYYFAWLQALGYFNTPTTSGGTTINQVYFYISADLDMTGWILPQVGTQEFPFVGNLDGNGHTISNLTVQNIEGTGANAWTDKPGNITGTNIVGFFGVIGSLNSAGTVNGAVSMGSTGYNSSPGYTYSSATNEVKNFTLEDAVIKTDLSESLVGIAAGYVNGPMENVKVSGGTISNVSATTALTNYTTNLSDFGAVGYCTEPYIGRNEVTTVKVYDPQVVTNSGNGAVNQQGNNWGNSVEMENMYNELADIYRTTTNTSASYPSEITVTHHADGTTTTVVDNTGTASLSVTAGNTTYPIKVTEVDDNGDVIASYSIVQRDGNTAGQAADWIYLYGEKEITTRTQTVHNIYEVEDNAIIIYSGSNYLTFNGSAYGNTNSSANATRWVNDNGKLYTLIDSDSDGEYDQKYYMVKNNGNALSVTAPVGINASTPAGITEWTIDTESISANNEWYLCYKDSTWKLVRNESGLITESTETNYLTLSGSPVAISNSTDKNSSVVWSKSGNTNFTLSTEINGTTYYLMCSATGVLSIQTSPASPTQWNKVDANGTAKPKIYTITDPVNQSGYALYYDAVNGWSTTGFTTIGTGTDWGGSVDMLSLNKRLYYYLNRNDVTSMKLNTSGSAYNSSSSGQQRRHRWISNSSSDYAYSVYSGNSTSSYKYYSTNPTSISGSGNLVYRLVGNSTGRSGYNISRTSDSNSGSMQSNVTVPGSYFPINVDPVMSGDTVTGYTTSDTNTGYIASAGNDGSTTVRTAAYGIQFIGNSLSSNGTSSTGYVSSQLEVLTGSSTTYSASAYARISDSYNESNSNVSSAVSGYSKTIQSSSLQKYDSSRASLNSVLSGQTAVHGLHFTGSTISNSNKITVPSASINGVTYNNYQVPTSSVDFVLKESGYINFFAGSYYNTAGTNSDSFFSLHVITRSSDKTTITGIREIKGIYENLDSSTNETYPYVYQWKDDNTYSTGTPGSMVFDMNYLWNAPPVANAVYYFELPANAGEYALGSVSSKTKGTYLMYLDISANAQVEGDSMFGQDTIDVITSHSNTTLEYSYNGADTQDTANVMSNMTYYPLAWDRANARVANTNTGYVIAGANTNSNPPGDIRVSRYTKYAQGNWASIRNSLTSANNAGILNNNRVYTIINGQQQTITQYGIGNQYTTMYAKISEKLNDQLRNNQYVYGLHFMQATIDTNHLVTAEKAVINGTTYTDYQMPEDSIDFNVVTRGRITLMAGTYFSGSQGTQSFFSLHKVFRNASDEITDIKEIQGIYGDGTDNSLYIYKYAGDAKYYLSDGSAEYNSLPSGYQLLYDMTALSNPTSYGGINSLTQNSVYYFELPADPGEYALGSSSSDGAYLIYLDIAANADFDISTTITEVTETDVNSIIYPEGVAFVDDPDSTVFDTNGEADPAKSVFLSIPISNSSGNTTFDMSSSRVLSVNNSSSSLAGYETQGIPIGASLVVNNGTPITATGTHTIVEKVTDIVSNANGSTVTTVTITTQTVENGVTTTTVSQTVTTTIGSNSTTVTTSPAPTYDGHTLIPNDVTAAQPTTASVILEYTFEGNDLTNTVERNGDLNIVTEIEEVIENGQTTYVAVSDVVRTTSADDGSIPAGTYDVTIGGTAGTYDVTVTGRDAAFDFTLNGTSIPSTGDYSVTVTAAP